MNEETQATEKKRKADNWRKVRTVRAFDDEWELIHRFAKLVKYSNTAQCEAFVELMESGEIE